MSNVFSILEGKDVKDIAESESHDVDAGTFNYYGFSNKKGEWVIMREKTDGTEYRFALGGTNYSTAWTSRSSQSYGLGHIG